jgi:hypothetical protein
MQLEFRSDTSTNWTFYDPTLAPGEWGYETDTGKTKLGYGSIWSSTPYYPSNLVGLGRQNVLEVYTASATWTVPTSLRVTGAKWQVTIVGGGGAGGAGAGAGRVGAGGGSGGVGVSSYTYVAGVNTMAFTVGIASTGAGNASSTTYNSVTYTANGGAVGGAGSGVNNGGAGGTVTGITVGETFTGTQGDTGGLTTLNTALMGYGGITPLGFGSSIAIGTAAGGVGVLGQGFGSGGSGGRTGSASTSRAGGNGAAGVLIIEY